MRPANLKTGSDGTGLVGVLNLSAQDAQGFSNQLLLPAAERKSYPNAWRILLLLLLLAFLPRFAMSWRIPTVCSDGTVYIALAKQSLEGSSDSMASHGGGLYPRILAALHSAGLPWETAGKLWGVVCASLVVLPLFGLVRRQFNDAVATVGCLIYAAHPELIEWSPEVIRDQTFWLFFVASLYFMWRGVVEIRIGHHLAAIVSMVACALCRIEGVVLLIPYVAWNVIRFRHLRVGRQSLAFCLAAAMVVPPLAIAVSGKAPKAVESVSHIFHLAPFQRVQAWWNRSPNAVDFAAAASGESAVQIGLQRQAWTCFRTIGRGLTEFLFVLMIAGMLMHARLVFRSDQLPLLLLCLAIVCGVWIHIWYSGGEASSRYSLPIAILGTRFAALALMRLADFVSKRAASRSMKWQTAVMLLPIASYTVVGWCDAISTRYESRHTKADLGHWIRDKYGDDCRLAGVDTQLAIVGFYAQVAPLELSSTTQANLLLEQIRQVDPDVILFSNLRIPNQGHGDFLAEMATMGFQDTRPPLEHSLRSGTLVLSRDPMRR